jgi:uncharacterized protein YjhX (UPF0386 family)
MLYFITIYKKNIIVQNNCYRTDGLNYLKCNVSKFIKYLRYIADRNFILFK